jgi:hypothetical protein
MDIQLPKKCFISHSYKDAESRERIISKLPPEVEPNVFPKITVPPDQFVSNELIQALTDCDALIYLTGGSSDYSFWVAFERDYALQTGIPVFAADIHTNKVVPHLGGPLALEVLLSFLHQDNSRINEATDFMFHQRNFKIFETDTNLLVEKDGQTFRQSIEEVLNRGGYVVVFWSHAASQSKWVRLEIQEAAEGIQDFNDRVLFAMLDKVDVPDFWMKFEDPVVQLYGDKDRPATHRLDDLVVRLYWLIYRKTEQRNLD